MTIAKPPALPGRVKRSVDGSGNLSLSFTKAGKTYQYSYKKGSEGLVLEK